VKISAFKPDYPKSNGNLSPSGHSGAQPTPIGMQIGKRGEVSPCASRMSKQVSANIVPIDGSLELSGLTV
jgi:hypothetical protein